MMDGTYLCFVCQYVGLRICMLCMSICNSVHMYDLYVYICWMLHMYVMYVNMLDGAYVCYVSQYV